MGVIALGSNQPGAYPDSRSLLEAAIQAFTGAGLALVARSPWWRSAAWPDPANPPYLNGIALVEPTPGPRDMLDRLQAIELEFGRRRIQSNAPRTLDLDLIAHGRTVSDEPDLILPHPRADQRLFVMGPLAQIAPAWRHPRLGRTAAELAKRCTIGLDATPV